MKFRDLPTRRTGDLEAAAASKAELVSIYGSDLRALLEMENELRKHLPDDLEPGDMSVLTMAARNASTSSARVKLEPRQLAVLLGRRGLLGTLLAEEARRVAAEAEAEKTAGAREIQSRTDDGMSRRTVLVGPDHGSGRPSVRTYGFDLEHLAGFLELHPETVRQAIRKGDLVPTDLGSIYTFKHKRDGRTKPKAAKGGVKP